MGLGKKSMKLKFVLEKKKKSSHTYFCWWQTPPVLRFYFMIGGNLLGEEERGEICQRTQRMFSIIFQKPIWVIFLSVVSVGNDWASYSEYGISLKGTSLRNFLLLPWALVIPEGVLKIWNNIQFKHFSHRCWCIIANFREKIQISVIWYLGARRKMIHEKRPKSRDTVSVSE